MDPHLRDPRLRGAVDSLPYRARRILLCWTAWAAAGGNAVAAMHIYAVQNLVCWFLLAALLWRWVPPNGWGNVGRWAAVLFSFGMACSVRGSLVDGPSLLLIALAVAFAEGGRLWWAAAILGAAGLARETNLLAAGILLSGGTSWAASQPRGRRRVHDALRLAVAAAPLAIWLGLLHVWLGSGEDPGARNFAAPFVGYAHKWREIVVAFRRTGWDLVVKGDLLVVISLTAQWLYLVLRPRWNDLWWRAAAPFALLGVFLGDAVWEGFPGATARVLLPVTAAFNLRVPRGRGHWLLLLLVGNLSVYASTYVLNPPARESCVVTGPRALRIVPGSGAVVDAEFDSRWYDSEKSWLEYWRWSRGSAGVAFVNPHPFPIYADVSFGLRANDDRAVAVRAGDRTLWLGQLQKGKLREVTLKDIELPPGRTAWTFDTFTPPASAGPRDPRRLTFSLRNLKLALRSSR